MNCLIMIIVEVNIPLGIQVVANKFGRMIKSILYYGYKNQRIELLSELMKGEVKNIHFIFC